MSYILVGIICGIFGCVIGIIVIGLCIAASIGDSDNYDDDEQMDKEESNE